MVADILPGPKGSDPKFLTPCGGGLWFSATDGARGEELYASDGGLGVYDRDAGDAAAPGTFAPRGMVGTRLAADLFPGPRSSKPDHLVCLNGVLLFAATTEEKGRELWKAEWTSTSDTSTLSVDVVADIKVGHGSSNPEYPAVLKNRVYFSADDGRRGAELWVTDGAAAAPKSFRPFGRLDGRIRVAAVRPLPPRMFPHRGRSAASTDVSASRSFGRCLREFSRVAAVLPRPASAEGLNDASTSQVPPPARSS